jgi:GntR family transcriptional regulator
MEFNANIPIYLQVISYIEKLILLHEWQLSEKIPSVRELAKTLQVNPGTIQKAYSELEKRQILIAIRGIGKQVTADPTIIQHLKEQRLDDSLKKFYQEMKPLNITINEVIGKLQQLQW